MPERIESELINLGLTPKEAKVYIATLKLGEAPASEIAARCRLPRLTTYAILERLIKKGWIFFFKKRHVRIYQVASVEAILEGFDFEEAQIQSKRHRIQMLIPRIQPFVLPEDREEEFRLGSMRLIEDRLQLGEWCIHHLNSCEEWLAVDDGSLTDLIRFIDHKTKAHLRYILPYSKRASLQGFRNKVDLYAISNANWNFPTNFFIMGSKVLFIKNNEKEFLGLEIDHPHVAKTLRSLIDLMCTKAIETT